MNAIINTTQMSALSSSPNVNSNNLVASCPIGASDNQGTEGVILNESEGISDTLDVSKAFVKGTTMGNALQAGFTPSDANAIGDVATHEAFGDLGDRAGLLATVPIFMDVDNDLSDLNRRDYAAASQDQARVLPDTAGAIAGVTVGEIGFTALTAVIAGATLLSAPAWAIGVGVAVAAVAIIIVSTVAANAATNFVSNLTGPKNHSSQQEDDGSSDDDS